MDRVEVLVNELSQREDLRETQGEQMELALEAPELILPLVTKLIDRAPDCGVFDFNLLSFMPYEQLDELAHAALENMHQSYLAVNVFDHIALQKPSSMHKYLRDVFVALDEDENSSHWPWRESGKIDYDGLTEVLADVEHVLEERLRSFKCLLNTGDVDLVGEAVALAEASELFSEDNAEQVGDMIALLAEEGYEYTDEFLLQRFSDRVAHIGFPPDYLKERTGTYATPRWHPTWQLEGSAPVVGAAMVGGKHESPCPVCKNPLDRLLTLAQQGDNGDQKVSLAFVTCLSCMSTTAPLPFYFFHSADGRILRLVDKADAIMPEEVVSPVKEVNVTLFDAGPRWRYQNWVWSGGYQSLNRVGGTPTWVEPAVYPRCRKCSRMMNFVAQLDDDLPTDEGVLYDAGGMFYMFLCEQCSITAVEHIRPEL